MTNSSVPNNLQKVSLSSKIELKVLQKKCLNNLIHPFWTLAMTGTDVMYLSQKLHKVHCFRDLFSHCVVYGILVFTIGARPILSQASWHFLCFSLTWYLACLLHVSSWKPSVFPENHFASFHTLVVLGKLTAAHAEQLPLYFSEPLVSH